MGAQPTWLETMWPKVRAHLPAPPAAVVEVGCGSRGGFVPALLAEGYETLGVDPQAPEGPVYRRSEIERTDLPVATDAVIACTSLHHVADPAVALDRLAAALAPDGTIIVIEWDWENFDEASARWCFERLDAAQTDGWLYHTREHWLDSGLPWDDYLPAFAAEHGLHGARRLIGELDARFTRVSCNHGPYFFSDLAGMTEADERLAIDAGEIRPLRIDYVGRAGATAG